MGEMFSNENKNTEEFLDCARQLECRVKYNEPLCAYTTFKIGGPCTAMVEISSEESLTKLMRASKHFKIRTMVIGKGSDLLFDDRGFNGVILLMGNSMDEISLEDDNKIRVQAGCSMIKLCRFALEHSLSGLEFAYGIPGSVGGAVFMNAGAYGGEIKDVIESCKSVSPDGIIRVRMASKLELGYRNSIYQHNNDIITGAVFKLERGSYDEIQDKMVDFMRRRKEKQPLEFPSAGSTFKRPEGQFAGKLIQDCGLKGYTVGGAMVSEKHSGFVINTGNATSEDVRRVIEHVQKVVREKTGYFLECEVRCIPYE